MPTLYTALRAKHRHRVAVPPQRVPGQSRLAAATTPSLLAAEGRAAAASPARSVVVVGGGLAGLCAAYELHGLRYDVKVLEARDRVGGRVHSLRDFIEGKVIEGGGELIGSNHPLWLAYREHFDLELSDVKEYGNAPIRFNDHTLTFEQSSTLTDELELQFKALTELAQRIVDPFEPWTTPDAVRLDGESLQNWIDTAECSGECKRAIAQQLASDNGVAAGDQSLLGVLAMIKGGGLDRFWTDTEVFRCKGGNQQLAMRFREALDKEQETVIVNTPVSRISKTGDKVTCWGRIDAKEREIARADDVILAVPPSAWSTIAIADEALSSALSQPPLMGANVKYLMGFSRRFWQDFNGAPTLTEDGPVDLTWESTEDDKAPQFSMVAFSGAGDAQKCCDWKETERQAEYIKALQVPYPHIGEELQTTRFMNWPSEEWTMASYYFPRRSDVIKWGPFWKAGYGGWLHFVGEHTCYAFVGYMEGALSSGFRLARRLAVRDGVLVA